MDLCVSLLTAHTSTQSAEGWAAGSSFTSDCSAFFEGCAVPVQSVDIFLN